MRETRPCRDSDRVDAVSGSHACRPKTKRRAASTALSFSESSLARRSPRLARAIVTMISRFTTQGRGRPSSGPKGTSEGIPRILVVSGATRTSCRMAYASSRYRRRTGRLPAGGVRSAHHISPRLIPRTPKPARHCPVYERPRSRLVTLGTPDIHACTP